MASELVRTLDHIVNGQLDASCPQRASTIAHKLGTLALEMGTQRSQVVLEMCHYQYLATPDEWKTGETTSAGGATPVDIMIHPSLKRLGDGRQDLHTKKIMVKGEFVPLHVGY